MHMIMSLMIIFNTDSKYLLESKLLNKNMANYRNIISHD